MRQRLKRQVGFAAEVGAMLQTPNERRPSEDPAGSP